MQSDVQLHGNGNKGVNQKLQNEKMQILTEEFCVKGSTDEPPCRNARRKRKSSATVSWIALKNGLIFFIFVCTCRRRNVIGGKGVIGYGNYEQFFFVHSKTFCKDFFLSYKKVSTETHKFYYANVWRTKKIGTKNFNVLWWSKFWWHNFDFIITFRLILAKTGNLKIPPRHFKNNFGFRILIAQF